MFLDTFYIEINSTWKASHELAFFRAKKKDMFGQINKSFCCSFVGIPFM